MNIKNQTTISISENLLDAHIFKNSSEMENFLEECKSLKWPQENENLK